MSTKANIGIPTTNGNLLMVYSHYDGYPEHVGRILKNNFNSFEKVKELLEGSDIRCFREHPLNGEVTIERFKDGRAVEYKTLFEASKGMNYVYVFESGEWKCYKPNFRYMSKEIVVSEITL